jgi:hypothetical protein
LAVPYTLPIKVDGASLSPHARQKIARTIAWQNDVLLAHLRRKRMKEFDNKIVAEEQADSTENSPATSVQVVAEPKLAISESNPAASTRRAPSAKEYRAKLLASRNGPLSPLGGIAFTEAELHEQSALLSKLDESSGPKPYKNLVTYQLRNLASAAFGVGRHLSLTLKAEVIALFSSLQSRDPIESMIHQQMVGLHIGHAESLRRAFLAGNWRARDVELRAAQKASSIFMDLVQLRDARRGRAPTSLSVGNVKVEPGGSAIVGKVEVLERASEDLRGQPTREPTADPED